MNTWHHRHSGLAAQSRRSGAHPAAEARPGLVSIGTRQGRRTRDDRTGKAPRSSGNSGSTVENADEVSMTSVPPRPPESAAPDATRIAALRALECTGRPPACTSLDDAVPGRFDSRETVPEYRLVTHIDVPDAARPTARCPRESRLQPSLSARRCERRLRRDCSLPRGIRHWFRMPPGPLPTCRVAKRAPVRRSSSSTMPAS